MADHSAEDLVPRLQAVMARGGKTTAGGAGTVAVAAPGRSYGAEPVGAGTYNGEGTR